MSENSAKGLWAIAAAGSLLLHASIGMAFYAMPIPEPRKQSRTEINIATLIAGASTQLASTEKAVIANAASAAELVEPGDQASIAADAAPVLAAAQSEPLQLGSSVALPALEPATPSGEPAIAAPSALAPETTAKEELIAAAPADQIDPSKVLAESALIASSEAAQPVELERTAAGNLRLETAPVASALSTPDPLKPDATAQIEPAEAVLPAASASIQPAPALQTATETTEVSARIAPADEPSLRSAQTVQPAIRSEIETIASLSETTPLIGLSEATIAAESETDVPLPQGSAPAQPSQPAQPGSKVIATSNESVVELAKTREHGAPLAAAPTTPPASILPVPPQPILREAGLSAVAPRPVAVVAPASAVRVGASDASAVPATNSASGTGQAVALRVTSQPAMPNNDKASVGEKPVKIAALPKISDAVGGSGAAKPNRLPITDFLAEHEDGDCLIAIPTGTGPTAASIEAFAVEKGAVERLGAEYQRLSGIPIEADTRPVSQAQCSALTFARSLAQYPNFPLRVSLANAVIESGQDLAGVVSGLRKDTIYLVVIDDEGKAEIAKDYSGQRSSVVTFSAPMTLTSGLVSSVQLLIAIASDGPLRTVPNRPGMPADEFFSKLATEIVYGQRSIAFGMTSFVVR